MKTDFWLVEKSNHNAVHGIFMSKESADNHLLKTIPAYCAKGYFMDKTLKPESFTVIPAKK